MGEGEGGGGGGGGERESGLGGRAGVPGLSRSHSTHSAPAPPQSIPGTPRRTATVPLLYPPAVPPSSSTSQREGEEEILYPRTMGVSPPGCHTCSLTTDTFSRSTDGRRSSRVIGVTCTTCTGLMVPLAAAVPSCTHYS